MENFIFTNLHVIGVAFLALLGITAVASLAIHALEQREARRREAERINERKARYCRINAMRMKGYDVRIDNRPENARWN